jgi:hypothetical protein
MVLKSPVESVGSPPFGVTPQVADADGAQLRSRHPTWGTSMPSPTAMPVRRLTPFGPPPWAA